MADIFRQVLQQIEDEADANDPAFIQLKTIMLEKIAALEREYGAAPPRAADWN